MDPGGHPPSLESWTPNTPHYSFKISFLGIFGSTAPPGVIRELGMAMVRSAVETLGWATVSETCPARVLLSQVVPGIHWGDRAVKWKDSSF